MGKYIMDTKAKKLYTLGLLGQKEALPSFHMIVAVDLLLSNGNVRLTHNKPIVAQPPKVVFYDYEEAETIALRMAQKQPGRKFVVVSSMMSYVESPTVEKSGFEDLL